MCGSSERALKALLAADASRLAALRAVRDLALPDAWVGAGFIRNAVWDALHGFSPGLAFGDVDVIWFDPLRVWPENDHAAEAALRHCLPSLPWSVRNQASMHLRNHDPSYRSATDAMRYWPETATAVAARLTDDDRLEVASPCGLDDLFDLTLRPTPWTAARRPQVFHDRLALKSWLRDWPRLRVAAPAPAAPASGPASGSSSTRSADR